MKNAYVTKIVFLIGVAALVSACSGEIVPENADKPESAYPVTLTEVTQRVVRYNCQNQVISDKIEVVSEPEKIISIHPTYPGWNSNNVSSSTFKNKQTGDTPDFVWDDVNFYVGYRSGGSMKVVAGLNQLDYSFNFTDGINESGSRFLNVTFTEKFNSSTLEYHPTTEECAHP